jgi:hypothetical protein
MCLMKTNVLNDPHLADMTDTLETLRTQLTDGEKIKNRHALLLAIDDAVLQGHKLTAFRKLVRETSALLTDLDTILMEA